MSVRIYIVDLLHMHLVHLSSIYIGKTNIRKYLYYDYAITTRNVV